MVLGGDGHLIESKLAVVDAVLRLHFQIHRIQICIMHCVCGKVQRPSISIDERRQVRGLDIYNQSFGCQSQIENSLE